MMAFHTTMMASLFPLAAAHGWPAPAPWLLVLLASGWLVAAGVWWALRRRQLQACRALERHLELLCTLDAHELAADQPPPQVPPLAAGHPAQRAAAHVWQALQQHCRRVAELEHARQALEIRSRRAALEAEQLRAVFRSLPDPVLAVDHYNELTLANTSAQRLFQLEAPAAEKRALDSLVHCEKLVRLLSTMAQHRSQSHRSDEVEITAEGQQRWYRVTAARLAREGDPGGDDGGTIAVLRDIGDQKALQKRNAEFVSAVSHEMKTPLAGIKAYVELLADGDAEDEETREEFLQVINGQTDRLQRLIDNMLNIARIEAGVVNVSKQHRSLNELLEEALGLVRPAAEAKDIELSAELSALYLGVLADRDMLLQAAINLLSNAIKYTPAGGRVTLCSRLSDDQVRFEVADTGVGLAPEDCVRVFEKFYRVKKDRDMAPGTGLGLPLAKHIVEDVHGGRLTVESTLGVGSTFIVTLPSAGQMT